MDDESYESIFVPIISKVMETFQPSAVVLQCGADSLTGNNCIFRIIFTFLSLISEANFKSYKITLNPYNPSEILEKSLDIS